MSGELFISLATNLGVLSFCAILVTIFAASYGFRLRGMSAAASDNQGKSLNIVIGVVFGLTCACLILSAHHFKTGSVIDTRAAPAILSGIVGGPIAAILTILIGGLSRAWVGGPFVIGGVLSVAIYAASGMLIAHFFRIEIRKAASIPYTQLVFVGLLCTVLVIPCFFLDQDWPTSLAAARAVVPIILLQNPVGVLLLGSALKLTLRVIQDRERLDRLSFELDESNRRLIELNTYLEASNTKLKDFSTIAAHDLRSPLHRLSALTQFLIDDLQDLNVTPSDDFLTNTELLEKTIAGMHSLVEDLVSYSLLDDSAAKAQSFDPTERVQSVITQIGATDGFTVEMAAPFPAVYAPPAAFDIVVRNLISNAIKHHDRAEGHIMVTARPSGAAVTFEVQDDGPGIPADYLDRIFRPFEKLRSRSEIPGSGLGLSFVRRLTDSWGGSVSVRSPDLRGATFSFTIPRSQNI